MRIAMWSGPRNLSTALMYSFGNRADCDAWDEPYYAAYLAASGADHPMRDACLAAQPQDAGAVADAIGALPEGRLHYLKMMTHHMLPGFGLDWAKDVVNIHLIRHPARVIASYGAKRDSVTLADIGFAEVERIYAALPGPVVDSADIRADPEGMLKKLCAGIGLDFDPAMLAWAAGPKPFDGVWAPHWYDAVHRSTGFAGPEGDLPEVAEVALLDAALPVYEAMREKRWKA